MLRGGQQQSGTVRESDQSSSTCTMSISVLSVTRPLVSVSGLLQVASLLGLVLLLLKATQLYLRRQWLLKAVQEFPSPPSHWLFGHKHEVKRGWTGVGRVGWVEEGRSHPPNTGWVPALARCEGCPGQRESTHVEGFTKGLWIQQIVGVNWGIVVNSLM